MDRNIQTRAIVLSVRKYGELHKAVTILSPDLGLVDAIIFGGRKGKKTALAPLFSISTLQLYHNPLKKEYSVTEGESSFIPQAITEDLACTYTASFFCEIISKTKAWPSYAPWATGRRRWKAIYRRPSRYRKETTSQER